MHFFTRGDQCDGVHGKSGSDRHQRDVSLVGVVVDDLASYRPRLATDKQVDFDLPLTLGFAEQVPAGQHQRLVAVGIDDRAGPHAVAGPVVDTQSNGCRLSPLDRIGNGRTWHRFLARRLKSSGRSGGGDRREGRLWSFASG